MLEWLNNVQATSPLAAQVRTALPHKQSYSPAEFMPVFLYTACDRNTSTT